MSHTVIDRLHVSLCDLTLTQADTLLESHLDTAQQLITLEFLAAAVFFNNEEAGALQPFISGKAQIALQALATAPNAVVHVPRVDNLRIAIAAERTIQFKYSTNRSIKVYILPQQVVLCQ